jgi:excisionase family DNA binding protein
VTDRLLTAKDVAALLNVPASWVLEHARAGTIPHVRLGRYVRFDEDEVRSWVETCRQGGRPTRLRRYDPATSPRTAGTAGGATPKE